MTENTPPAAVSALLPTPAPETPALGSLVEFNSITYGIEAICHRHASHKQPYDVEMKRRIEICWLYPLPVT